MNVPQSPSEKRDTVGKIASALALKEQETRSPIELQKEMNEKHYMRELENCVLEFRKANPRNFYVSVLTKNERLMPNVFRNYFFPVYACPTPSYDQAVYYYNHADERIEFLWVVPSKDACMHLISNESEVHSSERQLLNFVRLFYDGGLLRLAKKLNNELN